MNKEIKGTSNNNLTTLHPVDQNTTENPALHLTVANRLSQQEVDMSSHEAITSKLNGMTLDNSPRARWRLFSLVCYISIVGFIDSAPGALIPRIEEYFHINYAIVSLVWLGSALGFITIAVVSFKLESFLKRRQLICFGSLFHTIMLALIIPGASFPLTVIAFYVSGLGSALALSQHNIYISKFTKSATYLGYYHGGYGIGATLAPIFATSMVDSGIKWSYFYFVLLGLVICNFFNQWFAFAGCNKDLKPWFEHQQLIDAQTNELTCVGEDIASTANFDNVNTDSRNSTRISANAIAEPVVPRADLMVSLRNSQTWLVSLFGLCYQGAEVALPGWMSTYLEDYREGSKSRMGYVVSGFWAGLTIGRFFITPLLDKNLGCKKAVFIFNIISILFITLVWVIRDIVVEAVLFSIAGLFVGPIYPLVIKVASQILTPKIYYISLTIFSAFGASGGALFPFLIGLIAQSAGAFVVLPASIFLFFCCGVLWFMMPNPDRKAVNHLWELIW